LKKLSSPPEQPKGHVLSTTTIEQEENELKSEEITLICPQCRSQHKVEGGVDSLLTDFAIESELRRLKKADHSLSEQNDVKLRCGLCESTDPVVSYCADCCSPLCNFCLRAHHRQRLYNGHCIKSIDEVDSKLLHDDTSIPHIQHAGRLVCCKHLNQIPQIFCNSCNELVCCECVIEGHDGHRFVGIDSKTRQDMEKKVTDLSSKIGNVRQSFEEKLQYVTSVEKVMTEAEMQAKADIKKMFDSFITALQSRRHSLLVKAENHYSAKLKLLWSEKDYLEKLIAKLNTTLRFSERSQKCTNDGEYLSLASQALVSLKELEDSSWSVKTVEELNLRYLHIEKKVTEPKVFRTAANFEESKISLLTIEWKEFPMQVNLGIKHKAVLYVKRNIKSHQPFVLCEKPSIIIRHQHSPTCDVADISISRSTDLPSAWDVTFILYCGGPHTCMVSVIRANKLHNPFYVAGVPPVGSRVMRGPCWNYDETEHSYGASITDVAIITSHVRLLTEKLVTVRWSDGKLFCYRWDSDGMFDIQIYH
jgi:uncharacterized protein YbaR (Trm112 family)